jgi:hypothetical protein
MEHLNSFLLVVETYCAATRQAEATLSSRMLSDGKRLSAIRKGSDIGVRRLRQAMQWLSDNWPPDAVWPEDVERPPVSIPEAAE